jgi:tetratricopeptide (TPR) repeat protein
MRSSLPSRSTARFSLLCLSFLAAFTFTFAQSKPRPTQGTLQTVRNPLNDLLDEAQRDIDRNDFQAAIVPLQKFIAEKDDFAYAHFQLAYVYTALKRPADARPEYEKAMALDPKMSEAPLNLGILLLESDPAAAVSPLQKAVYLLPAQSRPRFLLGVALERSGNLKAAVESYEAALRLDPKDAETALHLGGLYLRENRPADAEKKFRAALDADPAQASAQLGLAESLEAQKNPQCIEAYQAYLKLKPGDSAARARYVHALIAMENYEVALAELEREDAGRPPTLELLKLRADVEVAQKKWDAAVSTLKQALALAPRDPQLHGGLGRIYLQQRDFSAAERELKTALQIDRNNLDYWKDLSSTYYLGQNYTAALAVLDVVAKVETPGKGVWFIRALCYDNLKQPQPAIDAYEKFLALEPDKSSNQAWQAEQRIKVLKKEVGSKN